MISVFLRQVKLTSEALKSLLRKFENILDHLELSAIADTALINLSASISRTLHQVRRRSGTFRALGMGDTNLVGPEISF